MKRLSISVDLKKLDKTRFVDRTYNNKEGVEVTVKEMKLDIVPLPETKVIASGDTWELVKVGFVCETATKEERVAKKNTNIVGEATQFKDKVSVPTFERDSQGKEVVSSDDIPF